MSLHIGNLSPHVRKDELEHVFGRFGRCTVQLKDRYGFAVYDFRGDAEKALRALKGRKICGEPISLSWSNKQPKPLQRFTRAARSHHMQYERNSGRVDNYVGRNFSRNIGDYSARHKSTDLRDDRGRFNDKNMALENYDQREEYLEEGDYVEPNQEDDGRWGEQVVDEQIEFDRYEPECGDERGEEYGKHGMGHVPGSPAGETTLDKNKRVYHSDSIRGHQTCYKCGNPGHKIRDCPLGNDLPGKNSYSSDHKHENETSSKSRANGEVGRPESRSRGRLQPSSRSSRSARRHETDENPSHSGKNGTTGRSSSMANRTRRENHNRRRRREREGEIVETVDNKKSKRKASPQLSTYSRSLNPLPGPSSHSKSGSLRPRSLSASSLSKSRSNRSRPRSSSPSSSLCISVGQSLPSCPQSKEVPTEVREQCGPDVREENLSIANKAEASLSGHIDNAMSNHFQEVLIERQLEPDSKYKNPTTNDTEVSLNGFLEDGQIPQSQDVLLEEKQRLEPESEEDSKPQEDMPVRSEDLSLSFKVEDDRKMDQSQHENGNDSSVHHASCEIKIPCPSLAEQGDRDPTAGKLSAEKLRGVEEFEDASALEMKKSLEPVNKSVTEAPCKLHTSSHLSISGKELCRVLKHYGLKHPEENGGALDVEDYFGSARLWPWEMIYYRRLKKGPISTENYARRVAQNKAFGITDKYIRSSCGWSELIEEKH